MVCAAHLFADLRQAPRVRDRTQIGLVVGAVQQRSLHLRRALSRRGHGGLFARAVHRLDANVPLRPSPLLRHRARHLVGGLQVPAGGHGDGVHGRRRDEQVSDHPDQRVHLGQARRARRHVWPVRLPLRRLDVPAVAAPPGGGFTPARRNRREEVVRPRADRQGRLRPVGTRRQRRALRQGRLKPVTPVERADERERESIAVDRGAKSEL
mmetsp:Transcript_24686/g.42141  ORF Transcript_24686/g.42141 Transcript_24686/m.42141 type:complete len:210 (+) Transcript_24686:759-1388(+)